MMDVMKKRLLSHYCRKGRVDGVLTSSTVQKSFAIFDRFNLRRIFSFYLCYSDNR
jgi:hypothetical protein